MRSISRFVVALSLLALPMSAIAADKAKPAAAAADKAIALTGTIGFVGSKVTGQHDGKFKDWKGSVTLKGGKADGAALEFTVQTASVEADLTSRNPYTEKLEGHLKSPDFFDVEKFPTATFKSTSIKADAKGAATIKGNLTLHGVTKGIEFPATVTVAGKDVSGKAEFSINRKDFGIAYAGKADDLIRDGVVLKIDLKGTAN